MSIEKQLKSFRTVVRKNHKAAINRIIDNYTKRVNDKGIRPTALYCIFCGSETDSSKEHVIPRWAFGGNEKKFFLTDVNGQKQNYIKTVVPACSTCNTDLLSGFELYIQQVLINVNEKFTLEQELNIIRWLELIEYKFQVLDITRWFLAHRGKNKTTFIKYLTDFPISMLRRESTYVVLKELRQAHKRLSKRDKTDRLNSFIPLKTKNPDFHFIHTNNDFIFLEMPQTKKALFYFFNRSFENYEEAVRTAMEIVEKNYSPNLS